MMVNFLRKPHVRENSSSQDMLIIHRLLAIKQSVSGKWQDNFMEVQLSEGTGNDGKILWK